METYANIRKLRKKLRQIEHLEEIDRDLTDEEVSKCMKKESTREELLRLLLLYNADESYGSSVVTTDTSIQHDDTSTATQLNTHNIIYTNTAEIKQEQTENSPRLQIKTSHESAEEVNVNNNERSDTTSPVTAVPEKPISPTPANTMTEKVVSPTPANTGPSPTRSPKKTTKKKGEKSGGIKDEWRNKRFQVSFLEGHNDLVTAVHCCDNLIVSASRDTTVKIWDITTLTEVRSLGSHTGTVTDVLIISGKLAVKLVPSMTLSENDHLVLSASTDCTLNVWLAETGELLKSVYTFNPITKIAIFPDLSLVATTSDGGKLELWDIDNKVNICSDTAHSDAVTGLCVVENRIYTCCGVEGEIKVYEVRDNNLHCLFASEKLFNISGVPVNMRHVRSLGVSTSHVFYGDDGVNLKVLTWKKGLVTKLPNHKEEFGMTDAIYCYDKMMITSAYDLDNGNGYINVFDTSSEPSYVTTLDCGNTRRILDICCYTDVNGNVNIITAGLDLLVWKQVSNDRQDEDIVETKFINRLCEAVEDSDVESEVEFTESESEADDNYRGSRRGSAQSNASKSWCTLT